MGKSLPELTLPGVDVRVLVPIDWLPRALAVLLDGIATSDLVVVLELGARCGR